MKPKLATGTIPLGCIRRYRDRPNATPAYPEAAFTGETSLSAILTRLAAAKQQKSGPEAGGMPIRRRAPLDFNLSSFAGCLAGRIAWYCYGF
jgi:hypothetical protein